MGGGGLLVLLYFFIIINNKNVDSFINGAKIYYQII